MSKNQNQHTSDKDLPFPTLLIQTLAKEKSFLLKNPTPANQLNLQNLDKTNIITAARNYDPKLLELLLQEPNLKSHFFTQTSAGPIFQIDRFIKYLSQKDFLPDSYTTFANQIGLTQDETFVSSSSKVVLDWPYKDCLLEGGQTNPHESRPEIFLNTILAADDITNLLAPKVFTDWKYYDQTGEHRFSSDHNYNPDDNLIIKGNNLLVLYSLLPRYHNQVQLIYIDPPFNTASDSFHYNDNFSRATWLTFMKNRLEVARELLAPTGTIYIHLDFNQVHYCKVLLDELFGEENFLNDITWQYYMGGAKPNTFARKHDQILMYSKVPNQNYFHTTKIKRYLHSAPLLPQKPATDNSTTSIPQLSQDNQGTYSLVTTPNVWSDINSVFNLSKEWTGFNTQKPEKLLARIIEASSKPGDLILDYHLGSGTTAKVAHKLGRRYIGIEQMTYTKKADVITGLQNVIHGDDTDFSRAINWQGGGSFTYCTLKDDANLFRKKALHDPAPGLPNLLELITHSNFLSHRVDPTKVQLTSFKKLSIRDQRRILVNLIDANSLYVNYSEINDPFYEISPYDKNLNQKFYDC